MKNEKLENNELCSFAMHYAFVHSYDEGEVNNSPSLTQPDEVLSISEMLANHVRGLPLNMSHEFDLKSNDNSVDNYIPDVNQMDLVERMEYAKEKAEEIKEITKKAKAESDAYKAKQKEEQETLEAFKEFRKKTESGKTDSE